MLLLTRSMKWLKQRWIVLVDRRSEEDTFLTMQQLTPTWEALLLIGVIFLLHTRQTEYADWKGDRKFNTVPNALSEASQKMWTVASLRDWDTPIPLEMCREDYLWSSEVYNCHRSTISGVTNASRCSSQHQGSWTIGTGANRQSISENLAVVWRMRPFVQGFPVRFLVMSPGLVKGSVTLCSNLLHGHNFQTWCVNRLSKYPVVGNSGPISRL